MSNAEVMPERDESGRFTTDVDEAIYDAVPENGEPVIASEVADVAGTSLSTTNKHLNQLADDGKIRKKKFHEKRVVWYKE